MKDQTTTARRATMPRCTMARKATNETAGSRAQFRICRSSAPLRFEPLSEPRYRCLTGSGRDGVASLLLNEQLEFILRPRTGIGLARACGAFRHARRRRSRVRISVDHQQWARRDERQHLWPVKLLVDARNHSVIKLTHEVRIDFHHACVFGGAVESGLESLHARLPDVVLERPAETLHADARDGD